MGEALPRKPAIPRRDKRAGIAGGDVAINKWRSGNSSRHEMAPPAGPAQTFEPGGRIIAVDGKHRVEVQGGQPCGTDLPVAKGPAFHPETAAEVGVRKRGDQGAANAMPAAGEGVAFRTA